MNNDVPTNPLYIEGARNYAKADASDPFTLARCMSHLQSGIAGYCPSGQPAFYNAKPVSTIRVDPMGKEYTATAYQNVVRP